MSLKFNFKKTIEFLVKEQQKITALKSLLKNFLNLQKNNVENISQFYKQMSDSASKISNKEILKLVTGFSIHQSQKQFSQSFDSNIHERGLFWLDMAAEVVVNLIEKSKRLQNQKTTIKQQEIQQFKKQMHAQMLKITKLKQSTIHLICQNNIKNNCSLIEELTNKMQKELQKKNKGVSAVQK